MKVLLTQADFNRKVSYRDSITDNLAPTYNINYLASVLRQKGIETIVLDSLYQYISTRYKSPISLKDGLLKNLELDPEIKYVGISITSPTRRIAVDLASRIKNINPNIYIIGGGPHITALSETFMRKYNDIFDFLVVGEADVSLYKIIQMNENEHKLFEEIPGIIFNGKNELIMTKKQNLLNKNDLNDPQIVPYTTYNQYEKYFNGSIPSVNLITSRGCPYHCSFCYSPILWGGYRDQSAERVINEIEFLVKQHGVREIRFQDDSFTTNRKRSLKIFEKIKEHNFNISMYMHTRFDCVDENLIKSFSDAGGREIFYGLESGSPIIRGQINKGMKKTNSEILEICRFTQDNNIRIGLWTIVGLPKETQRDIELTYELLHKIKPDEVRCNPAHVHPYTTLFYENQEEEEKYELDDWVNGSDDFFPYFKGKKGRTISSICKDIEGKYNKYTIRTPLEYEFETTLGKV